MTIKSLMLSRKLLVSEEADYSLVGLGTPLVTGLIETDWSSESMYHLEPY